MPLLDSLTALFVHRDEPGPTVPKPALQSVSIHGMLWGSIATVAFSILHMRGIPLDKDQTLGIVTGAQELKPQLALLFTAFATIWFRIKHSDFSVARLATPHFYFGLVTALLAFAQAFGVNTSDLGHMPADSEQAAAGLIGLGSTVVGVVGVIKSGKPIQSLRATPA